MFDSPPVLSASARIFFIPPKLASFWDIIFNTQHKRPTCTLLIPSVIQNFLRDHVAYRVLGSQPLYECLDPLTILSIQRITGTDDIPTSDLAFTSILQKQFLPIPPHDEVIGQFKQKLHMKSIRSNK